MPRNPLAVFVPLVASLGLLPGLAVAAPPEADQDPEQGAEQDSEQEGDDPKEGGEGSSEQAEPLSDEEVAALTQKGIEAYNSQEDYASAARLFKQVFEARPTRNNLWLYAQSVRMGGNCSAAVPLYERYIEGMEDGKSKADVQGIIDDCREVVDISGGTVQGEENDPKPADPESAEGTEPPDTLPNTLDSVEPIKPWYQDPLAPTLLGLGVAATAAGATLLGIAADRERGLAESSTYNEFVDKWHAEQKRAECYDSGNENDQLGSCRDFVIAGAATAGAGAALILGGVVRYLVLAAGQKRAEERAQELVVEPTASTEGFGLSLTGRF